MRKLLILIAVIVLTACSNRQAGNDAVERANSRCPIPVENVGFISSITLQADTLRYLCTVTEPTIDLARLSEKADVMKRNMLPVITSLFSDDAALLDELRARKWTLAVTYRNASDSLTLVFSPQELTVEGARATADNINPEERLADEIALSQAALPAQMTPAIVIDRVHDRGDAVVFECVVDEEIAGTDAMAELRRNATAIRTEMAAAMRAENPAPEVQRLVDVTTAAGRGIAYRYTGSLSLDTLTILFTPADLRR